MLVFLSISVFGDYEARICYQEQADVVPSCSDGSAESSWNETDYFYSNYSIPSNIINATWQVKHGTLSTYDVVIPTTCLDNGDSVLQVRMRGYFSLNSAPKPDLSTSYGQCYTGSTWQTITSVESTTPTGASVFSSNPTNAYDSSYSTYSMYGYVFTNPDGSYYSGTATGLTQAHVYEEGVLWNLNASNRDSYFINGIESIYYLNDSIYNETGSIKDSFWSNDGTGYGKTFNLYGDVFITFI
jgi:hypothetical protein